MANRRLTPLVLTVAVFMAAWALHADSVAADDSYIQLTRISLVEGNVSYQRVPDEEWSAVGVNMPLEPGDRIYTGQGGRAEIEFEEGSVLRLGGDTDIEVLTLGEDFVQIRMLLGLASLATEKGVDFEIATPAAAFSTEKDGLYRFEVAEDGRSAAIVRSGRLEAVDDDFSRVIGNGDRISVYPGGSGPEVVAADRRDAWDEWVDRRSADRRAAASRRYLSGDVYIGVGELDRHGRWVQVSTYGWGWVPHSVGSSWSPYSVGRWVYRPRFGWTWVSQESWGWLPYHYGRWYRDAAVGWCWLPGDGFSFGFWSPGLVAFYRGAGWVSWGPLGPGDYYDVGRYHYRRAHAPNLDRMRALAVRHPGDFINRNVRNAFQTVDVDRFRRDSFSGRGGFDGRGIDVRRSDIDQPWRQGELVRGRLDISPVRESFRSAPERPTARPALERARTVVVRRTPTQVSGNSDRLRPVANPRPNQQASSRPAGEGGRREAVGESRPDARRLNPSRRDDSPREAGAVNPQNSLRGDSLRGNSLRSSTD
ncbi:MAG: FecR family protein, partial [Acidobacteriota bacterium]|nr:FecR family protein [Acidobacteriota bacterium]